MLKKCFICDRCGHETKIGYSILIESENTEGLAIESDVEKLNETFDFCGDCIRQIIDVAKDVNVKVAYPVAKPKVVHKSVLTPKFVRDPGDEDISEEQLAEELANIKEMMPAKLDTNAEVEELAAEVEEAEQTPWYESGADGGLPFPEIEQTDSERKAAKGRKNKVDHAKVRELRDKGMSCAAIAAELEIKVSQVQYSLAYYKNKNK